MKVAHMLILKFGSEGKGRLGRSPETGAGGHHLPALARAALLEQEGAIFFFFLKHVFLFFLSPPSFLFHFLASAFVALPLCLLAVSGRHLLLFLYYQERQHLLWRNFSVSGCH